MIFSDGTATGWLLVAGVPACIFLIGYGATIWLIAEIGKVRLRTGVYTMGAICGLAIYLCWPLVAPILGDIVSLAMLRNPSAFVDWPPGIFLEGAVLWPLGWCLLTGVILLAGGWMLTWPVRSVLVALIVGFLAVLLPMAFLIEFGLLFLDPQRVQIFLVLLVVAVGILVVASRRSRVRDLDRTVG